MKEIPPWNRYNEEDEEVGERPWQERLTEREKRVKEIMDRAWESRK